MAHSHNVYDTDTHFIIDGFTRAIKNATSVKTSICQYDNNSERFTFELPRHHIDGHDMSLCNEVKVKFINSESGGTENTGDYIVDDLAVSEDDDEVVIFSWLIDDRATQLSGSLSFQICFVCESADDYTWHTDMYKSVTVKKSISPDGNAANSQAERLKISVQRGTSATFGLTLKNADGTDYTLQDGEVLIFGVAKEGNFENILLSKTITNAVDGQYMLQFVPEDTESMAVGAYVYDVGLKQGTHYYPIIKMSSFEITQNITKRDDWI